MSPVSPPPNPGAVSTDLPREILEAIEQSRLSEHPRSHLIAILQMIQRHYGYLSRERIDAVAQLMQVPTAMVSGVATFYHFFTFVPKGKHQITVCLGTACYVKGSGQIMDRLKELLHIEAGQTSADGQFYLEAARCLGACALAPVMVIDGKVYGGVRPDGVEKILANYGYVAKNK